MALEYYAILTAIGTAAIANAAVLGEKINLTQFAVGDGGGSYYKPTKEMTALKGEKWRGEINDYAIDTINPDLINVKGVIPAAVGGFTIREMGIFDSQGRMIAIANTPDSVKITTDSGAVKEMELVMELLVSNADVVKIEVNPTVSIATKEDIEKHNTASNAHKELFDKKANKNLDNVTREDLVAKLGNITEELEDRIGITTDTDGAVGAGTVMGKLNAVLEDGSTVQVDVAEIKKLLGTATATGGSATAGSVMAKLNALLQKVMVTGVGIKKVQRGYFNETPIDQDKRTNIKVNLSTIDPQKTFVILRGGGSSGMGSDASGMMGHLVSVTATSFTYATPRIDMINREPMVSYEVVEFY